MTEPVRLAKRVIALTGCSRREAEQYIEGGWVRVDGVVIERPQFMVGEQALDIDPAATLAPPEPATLVWNQPTGLDIQSDTVSAQITPLTRWPDDPSGVRPLHRHLIGLRALLPLPAQASGLLIFSQDWRVVRRLTDDRARIEQEFVVEVEGHLNAEGLQRLNRGAHARVSWQSDQHLRFACKGTTADQLQALCAEVGLRVIGVKRLRVGRIPLARLPAGQWRYMAPAERF